MKVAEGQHKETKPDRAEVDEEGVYVFACFIKRETSDVVTRKLIYQPFLLFYASLRALFLKALQIE